MGWIGPIIIRMKMLFQEICRENLDWDVNLEGQFKLKWEEIVRHLLAVKEIKISRCIYKHPKRVIRKCFLHGFGDASTKGYCAVVYYFSISRGRRNIYSIAYFKVPSGTTERINYPTIRTYVSKNSGTING